MSLGSMNNTRQAKAGALQSRVRETETVASEPQLPMQIPV